MRSDAFRAAVEAKDLSQIDRLFTEDAVFRSPVVYKPYQGREAVKVVLGAALQVLEDFRYLDQLESDDSAVLRFAARVGEREVEGVDILRLDADGRVVELSVMVRPMSAIHALAERMGEVLEAPPAART